jgi:hypothetical protein
MKPDLTKVTFIEEERSGYSTKYRVTDGSGNEWVVKLGKESQSDTAASRLVWAVGYGADISYLAPRVTIEGKGVFENARFEARPKDVERIGEWHWRDNPFEGTKEFQGLKIMMVLINNWDIKDANNKILAKRNQQTGVRELHYIISDLGATFGKTGNFMTRTRNKLSDYVKAEFIKGARNNYVVFSYNGKQQDLFRDITVEHAVWIGSWLSKLTSKQISDAFRAANYSDDEVTMLTEAVLTRIDQLNKFKTKALLT